ncbi:Translation initiation factor 2 beta subunit [Entamoeba marina]
MTDIEQKPTISEETPIEKKTKQPKTGKTKVTTELPSFSEVSKKSKKKEKPKSKAETNGLYAYDDLLDMIFSQCNISQNNNTKEKELPQVKVVKEGSKRVNWINFSDICRRLHREPEDVKLFVLEELMTTGSVDAKGGFTVRGKYYSSQLENIIYKYVKQYVICKVCDSLDTEFVKENRITFIYCNHCTSKMSVEMKKQT